MTSDEPGINSSLMRSTASGGNWTRSSASAADEAALVWTWTTGLGASLDLRRLLLRSSIIATGSVGIVIRFQRMPAPLSVTVMAVKTCVPSRLIGVIERDQHVEQRQHALPDENLLFLAAHEHCDLTRELGLD